MNDVLNIFWNVFSIFTNQKPEDLPDFIRMLTTYKFEDIDVKRKITIEGILKENQNVLSPDVNFKIDQLTGCFCHAIREIVFGFGCWNNMQFVMSSEYNTKQHYSYLVEKKKYLNKLKSDLNSFFS